MNLKAPKRVFKEEKMNPNYYDHCFVIGCLGNSLLHLD